MLRKLKTRIDMDPNVFEEFIRPFKMLASEVEEEPGELRLRGEGLSIRCVGFTCDIKAEDDITGLVLEHLFRSQYSRVENTKRTPFFSASEEITLKGRTTFAPYGILDYFEAEFEGEVLSPDWIERMPSIISSFISTSSSERRFSFPVSGMNTRLASSAP